MGKHYSNALAALWRNDLESFESKIQTIANINEIDRDGRSIAFHTVIENSLPALKIVENKGANLSLHDKKGWTLLHYAANNNSLEIASFLISNGVDINAIDKYGNNVIWRATYSSNECGDMIKLLLASGADPTMKNNYNSSAIDLANIIANYDLKVFFKGFR